MTTIANTTTSTPTLESESIARPTAHVYDTLPEIYNAIKAHKPDKVFTHLYRSYLYQLPLIIVIIQKKYQIFNVKKDWKFLELQHYN